MRKITRPYNRIIVLILAAVLITACSQASTPTPFLPTAVMPTLTSAPTAAQPTPISPTAAALSAAPTSAPPTTAPTVVPTAVSSPERSSRMKIRIKLKDKELTATLIDSKTTQDFLAQLPLTLTLEDYAGTEKINVLTKRLSTEGAPSGSDPSVGDIAYFAPWGNLVIYYRDFGYSNGLVILGKIDGGVEALQAAGSVSVIFERMD